MVRGADVEPEEFGIFLKFFFEKFFVLENSDFPLSRSAQSCGRRKECIFSISFSLSLSLGAKVQIFFD